MGMLYVYFANDQINILDNHHQRVDFDAVLEDDDGWWDAATFTWRPLNPLPLDLTILAHISWGPPPNTTGYGKFWAHDKHNTGLVPDRQIGEGRRDGPLSAANPGINFGANYRLQPSHNLHMVFMGFSGADGHVIQSGKEDDEHGTPQRSFLSIRY